MTTIIYLFNGACRDGLREAVRKAGTKSEAVRELESMADQYCIIHDNGSRRQPKRTYNDKSMTGLLRCIHDYIIFSGGEAAYTDTEGRPIGATDKAETHGGTRGGAFWRRGCIYGIGATIQGRTVSIMPAPRRESIIEGIRRQALEERSHIYIMPESFEEFVKWCNEVFVVEPKRRYMEGRAELCQ